MGFLETFNNSFHSVGYSLKDKAPTIAVIGGMIGVTFAGVLACKNTLQLPEIIDFHKEAMQEITDNLNEDGTVDTTQGPIKASEAAFKVQTHLCWSVVKLYIVPVSIAGLSLGAIGWSHVEMNRRYTKVLASYVALSEVYRAYRERVKARYGEDAERDICYKMQNAEVEEEVLDSKGKVKRKKMNLSVIDPEVSECDDYSAFYYRGNVPAENWNMAMSYNLFHIKQVETWANAVLREKTFLTINDVLRQLEIDERESGQYIGWIYSEDNRIGDNAVEIKTIETQFRNPITKELEPGYILEFNADGNIMQRAFKKKKRTA